MIIIDGHHILEIIIISTEKNLVIYLKKFCKNYEVFK